MALKAVKEAAGVVTLLIAAPVLKEIPAGNRGLAVCPRLPLKRAVPSVPLTFMVVTQIVTNVVSCLPCTVFVRTTPGRRRNLSVLAVSSGEVERAVAAQLERVCLVFHAGSSILAGQRTSHLAVWPAEARPALTIQMAGRYLHTLPAILASLFCTVLHFPTVQPGIATRTRTAVAVHRAHVHRADASVAARTGQTEIHHGFTMTTRVTKATAALVVIDQLDAVKAAVTVAGSSLAFVQIPLAVVTSEPRRAVALVTAHTVFTLSSILTERLQRARLGGTVIHVKLTLESMCSRWASALKVIDEVDACSSV